jgi:alpha-beta hydrolase superfamily lysophospholipase
MQMPFPLQLLSRLVLSLGAFIAIAYTSVCLSLLVRQNRFIFLPSPRIEITPERFNLRYQDVWLPVSAHSGKVERIHGWWIPAAQPETGVMLYLHGNGINIGANVAQASYFHQLGFSVFLIDYRGYGRSDGGFPTEATVYQDAQIAWDYLVQQRQVNPQRIFIYGHSLGGAIAIDLAVRHPKAAGLIVESSFTSMQEMADLKGWSRMFPVDLLLTQRFDSAAKVKLLKLPVLFTHGTLDERVPFQMSQTLFAATPKPKQLALFPGASHNNLAEIAGPQYLQVIQKFIEQVQAQQNLVEKD